MINKILLSFLFFTTTYAVENGWLQSYVTQVYNYPSKGNVYPWYANLLKDPEGFRKAVHAFAEKYRDYKLDAIAGIDSSGLVFATALAYELRVPFVMIEKPGYLPRLTERNEIFEIEVDSLPPGGIVLVMEDILSSGITAKAACDLVERLGCMAVEVACLIEIKHLHGRDVVERPVFSLLSVQ